MEWGWQVSQPEVRFAALIRLFAPPLTEAGGISFSGPERGWAADSILNVEMVLADASIVNANSTSHPDLLAAVKGGQANFGIITRFDLQAFPAHQVWGGLINYDAGQDKALITAFSEFKKPENYDPYAAGWISYQYNGSNAKLTPGSSMWYSKADQAPGALGRITNIGPHSLDLVQVALPSAHSKAANDGFKLGGLYRTIWTTLSFHISPTILHRIYDHWLENIPSVTAANSIGTDVPFSELYIQSGMPRPCEPTDSDTPENALGWPPALSPNASHPWKDVVVFQLCLSWQDERATDGLEDAAKKMIAEFEGMIKDEGLETEWFYMNYAADWQDVIGGYGDETKDFLQKTAKKYDPAGFWQTQLQGGFKVF